MKTLDYNAIQKEIHDNYLDLKSGVWDVYDFMSGITEKYVHPFYPEYTDKDAEHVTDLLFAMFEINGIELY